MRKIFLTTLFAAVLALGVHAQKFGYVNATELLSQLPEVEAADKQLETFQNQLLAEGQKMVNAFETSYQAYMNEVQAGLLSKVQMAEREEMLSKEQQSIANFEKEVQLKILQKREELLKPILEKIDMVIQEIGKEGGFTFIFDSGTQGAMLYAPDSENLIEEIKAKLGVQ